MTVGSPSGNPSGNTAVKSSQTWLGEKELQDLSQRIETAERGTYGEIIPMMAERSIAWRHISSIIALFVFSLGMAVLLVSQNSWDSGFEWVLEHLIWVLPGWLLLSFALAMMLARIPILERLFASPSEREEACHLRAELEFYRNHFDRSQKHASILLFLSVLEKKAVVLIDPELLQKIPESTRQARLDEIVKSMLSGIKAGGWAEGFGRGIDASGKLLREFVPGPADYRHEYPAQVKFCE